MFVGKARSLPEGSKFQLLHSRVGSGHTHKHLTRLERLVKGKHSSLLWKFLNYGRKIGPSWPKKSMTLLRMCWSVRLLGYNHKQRKVKILQNFFLSSLTPRTNKLERLYSAHQAKPNICICGRVPSLKVWHLKGASGMTLFANIIIGWQGLPGTNTQVFWQRKMVYYILTPGTFYGRNSCRIVVS